MLFTYRSDTALQERQEGYRRRRSAREGAPAGEATFGPVAAVNADGILPTNGANDIYARSAGGGSGGGANGAGAAGTANGNGPPAASAQQTAGMALNPMVAKMMATMGYAAGQGLGREGQGITAPVEARAPVARRFAQPVRLTGIASGWFLFHRYILIGSPDIQAWQLLLNCRHVSFVDLAHRLAPPPPGHRSGLGYGKDRSGEVLPESDWSLQPDGALLTGGPELTARDLEAWAPVVTARPGMLQASAVSLNVYRFILVSISHSRCLLPARG